MSIYDILSAKRDGRELTREQIETLIGGYVDGRIPDYQAAAFLMAVYIRGMSGRELADLTELMMNSGDLIPLDGVPAPRIDKHSTGGVGDKVSLVLAPLVAACDVRVPMLSGRGLGHTGGTLDKLESIPGMNVQLSATEFRRVLADVGTVISGQTANLVPADRKLYALRDTTATVSSIPLIASSIMSKKLALQSDGLVLDVKTGSGAFMQDENDAQELARVMVDIGRRANRPTVGLVTDMDAPLGRMIGNALEIHETIDCLKGDGPENLMGVTLALAKEMLKMAGKTESDADAERLLENALGSGRALEVFRKMIEAQGGDPRVCDDSKLLPAAPLKRPWRAPRDGFVHYRTTELGMAAVELGAGRKTKDDTLDLTAGIEVHVPANCEVRKNDRVLTLYGAEESVLDNAALRLDAAVEIEAGRRPARPLIMHRVE